MQTLCWSKSSPSFSSAHSSCISRSIITIFVPHIGMYIRINMSKTDFIYLKIWCDSVTFCQRGLFLTHPVHPHNNECRYFIQKVYVQVTIKDYIDYTKLSKVCILSWAPHSPVNFWHYITKPTTNCNRRFSMLFGSEMSLE